MSGWAMVLCGYVIVSVYILMDKQRMPEEKRFLSLSTLQGVSILALMGFLGVATYFLTMEQASIPHESGVYMAAGLLGASLFADIVSYFFAWRKEEGIHFSYDMLRFKWLLVAVNIVCILNLT